jgi:hypothetical protein
MSWNKKLEPHKEKPIAFAVALGSTELSIVLRGLVLVTLALIIGSGIPALLAYYGDVFTQEEIYQKLPSKARDTIAQFRKEQEQTNTQIARIDVTLGAAPPGSEAHHRLLESRQALRAAQKDRIVPLQYYGYMGSQSPQFYYPLFYFTLGALVFLLRPSGFAPFRRRKLQTMIITVGIYVGWQWFHWVRNLVSGEESRVIYTYTNWDINVACFTYQELEAFLISFLIATIWCQWLGFYRTRISELRDIPDHTWSAPLHYQNTERLSDTFSRWQIASLLLVAAFSSFFAFYWKNIHGRGDPRYLISALAIHVVGIASWVIVSLPMTTTWRHWHSLRARAIYELATSTDEIGRVDMRIKTIDSVKPVGSWNLLISTTLLFVSFILPIVQMVIR